MNTALKKLRRSSSKSSTKRNAEILSCRLHKLNVKELEDGRETFLLRSGGEGMSLVMSTSDDSSALKKQELTFSAKIAAAMDTDGRIGVQEHLSKTLQKLSSQELDKPKPKLAPLRAATDDTNTNGADLISSCRDVSHSVSFTQHYNPRASSLFRKRNGWMTFRKLRRRRTFLVRFWKTSIKRLLGSSTRRQQHKALLE